MGGDSGRGRRAWTCGRGCRRLRRRGFKLSVNSRGSCTPPPRVVDIGCRACRSPRTGRWGRTPGEKGGRMHPRERHESARRGASPRTNEEGTPAAGRNKNRRALRRGHLCRDGREGRGGMRRTAVCSKSARACTKAVAICKYLALLSFFLNNRF